MQEQYENLGDELDAEELYREMCQIEGYPCPTCTQHKHKDNPEKCSVMCLRWKLWRDEFMQRVKANAKELREKGEIRIRRRVNSD